MQDKYSIVYANLIHSHDGKMYSSAYTKDEQLNVSLGPFFAHVEHRMPYKSAYQL